MVHDQPVLNDVTKFGYLKSCLKSQAVKALEGLPVTGENYAQAVDILKSKFGTPQILVAHLYAKLQQVPTATAQFSAIKSTHEAVEKYLRQLEALGEHIENPLVIQQVQAKFPVELTSHLEERKGDDEIWTVASLRTALNRYIRVRDTAHNIANVQRSGGTHAAPKSSPRMPTSVQAPPSSVSTADALLANAPKRFYHRSRV